MRQVIIVFFGSLDQSVYVIGFLDIVDFNSELNLVIGSGRRLRLGIRYIFIQKY